MEDIKREEILKSIRKEILDKGYTKDETAFSMDRAKVSYEPYSDESMAAYLSWMDQVIDGRGYGTEVSGRTLKKALKKILCAVLGPVLIPVIRNAVFSSFERQEYFNLSVSDSVHMAAGYMLEKDREIALLKQRISDLEEKLK